MPFYGRSRGLPVPAQGACTHAGFYDHAGAAGNSHIVPDGVAFRSDNTVGIPYYKSFAAQWPACVYLDRRFTSALTSNHARLEVGTARYAFPVMDLHHLLLAGLYRRTVGKLSDDPPRERSSGTAAGTTLLPVMISTRHPDGTAITQSAVDSTAIARPHESAVVHVSLSSGATLRIETGSLDVSFVCALLAELRG